MIARHSLVGDAQSTRSGDTESAGHAERTRYAGLDVVACRSLVFTRPITVASLSRCDRVSVAAPSRWLLGVVSRSACSVGATDDHLVFLDFDTDSEDGRLDSWLAEPRAKRELGAVYYGPDGPSETETDGVATHNTDRVLPEAFDELLFVREAMPSRVLDCPEH